MCGSPSENPPLKTLTVHDFNGGVFKNNLGGDSGTWDLDPEDDSASCDAEIVEMEGPQGPGKVLRLDYDVDSETEVPAKCGFWTKLGDLDAEEYDHLEFYVKGDSQKGFSKLFRVEIKKFENTDRVGKLQGSYIVKNVTSDWQKISIPLNAMTGILNFADPAVWKDPSIGRRGLDEFVIVFEDRRVDKKTGRIYVDDIRFVRTGNPGPSAVDFPPRLKGDKTPVRLEGVEFMQFLVKRLKGFPSEKIVRKSFPAEDRAFLTEVARDTWRFFDEIVDQEHHLPLDTIQLGQNKPVDAGGWVGDYTNVTNIGIYLMCVVAGYDLGFISREDAVKRIGDTIKVVGEMDFHKPSGFLYNYYDTTQLERTSYFVSFVDSGWLAAGLYVAKGAFPDELGKACDKILNRGNFRFFYDPVDQQMFHGYYDHLDVYSDYHYGVFYAEPRAVSAIAIGRGEVPVEHWFRMVRTFPDNFTWQEQFPVNRFKKKTLGFEYEGGNYEWKDLEYVPSWGGSAFEALMPTMILAEKELAPEGLGKNDEIHVQGQIRYAKEELGYPVWGMSPSSVPEGGYSEYGAKPFGCKGYKAGVVTPHASFLSLEFAPEEAVANLRKLLELYDVYGEYGFYDAVTVETGLVAYKYLCLDQGMSLISLCNYLKEGSIRRRFHANADLVSKIDPLIREEKFFDASQRSEEDRDVVMREV
ncbi:MAG TPA: glucoamylase family protein [Candidatus Omnitrophota bacterium]|nr:glucoamylase family protein [Candidatus Omnitrophota bacterium]